jgi:hypothetical protein
MTVLVEICGKMAEPGTCLAIAMSECTFALRSYGAQGEGDG